MCLVIHANENVTSVNHRKQQLYAYAMQLLNSFRKKTEKEVMR